MGQYMRGCFAFVAAASLTLAASCQAYAEDASSNESPDLAPKVESATYSPEAAERHIQHALGQPLRAPLQFIETPLNQITQVLAEDYGIQFQFDTTALDALAVNPEMEVTVEVGNVSLRSALNLMLRNAGGENLTYLISDEVLLITTEEAAEQRLETRVYRVDDIDVPASQSADGTPSPAAGSCLVEILTSCVEPESWQKSGEGQMRRLRPGVLVVYQTRRVHQELERVIDSLRQVTAAVNAGSTNKQSVAAGENPFEDF